MLSITKVIYQQLWVEQMKQYSKFQKQLNLDPNGLYIYVKEENYIWHKENKDL